MSPLLKATAVADKVNDSYSASFFFFLFAMETISRAISGCEVQAQGH